MTEWRLYVHWLQAPKLRFAHSVGTRLKTHTTKLFLHHSLTSLLYGSLEQAYLETNMPRGRRNGYMDHARQHRMIFHFHSRLLISQDHHEIFLTACPGTTSPVTTSALFDRGTLRPPSLSRNHPIDDP
ncbi:unnamed protein product [Penicillium discolor]